MFNFNFFPFNWLSPFGDIGLPMLVLGLISFGYTFLFTLTSKRTQGVVVGLAAGSGSKGGTVYRPVYTFRTEDGNEITRTDKLGSNPPRFKVGQEVQVLYGRLNPRNSRINTVMSLYFTPAMFSGMGAIFLGADLLMKFDNSKDEILRSILQFLGFGG